MIFLRTLIGLPCEKEPGAEIRTRAGKPIEAETLGEAITQAELVLGVQIVPHDPPKYFRVYGVPGNAEYRIVDIHVRRDGKSICPKQDLSFPLIDSDFVDIGGLAC